MNEPGYDNYTSRNSTAAIRSRKVKVVILLEQLRPSIRHGFRASQPTNFSTQISKAIAAELAETESHLSITKEDHRHKRTSDTQQ